MQQLPQVDAPTAVIWIFAILCALHGAIHLLGAAKGFGWADVDQLTQSIATPMAAAWLLAAALLAATTVTYIAGASLWWVAGTLGIVVSQCLIILHWHDAWAGTVANVVILVGCILGFGVWQFEWMVEREVAEFRADQAVSNTTDGESTDGLQPVDELPPPVQRWQDYAGATNEPPPTEVSMQFTGRMRTEPGGDWMPVESSQVVRTVDPGFLWAAVVNSGSLMYLTGRDKYVGGEGEMLIQLYSLIPVADATGAEMDQGAMVRYLAEMVWYPSAARRNYLEWEPIDSTSAKATMQYGGIEAGGIFTFDAEGRMTGFEADRYYDRPDGATMERWVIDIEPDSYTELAGARVPTRGSVTWKLEEDFTWYELELLDRTRR